MFDAVVFATSDPEPAARTLSSLVEGAVDGLLNHMLLISAETSEGLAALADAAGCRLEQGVDDRDLPAILARHLVTPHALAFAAGALPTAGWSTRLRHELNRSGGPDPEMSLVFRPERTADRLKLLAFVSFRGRMPLAYGVLTPRALLINSLKCGSIRSHGPIHMTETTVGRI